MANTSPFLGSTTKTAAFPTFKFLSFSNSSLTTFSAISWILRSRVVVTIKHLFKTISSPYSSISLIVTTTLNLKIQEMAEKVVKEELEKLKNLNVGNAAVLVVDPKNGEVLAMVGSKDYFDTK